MNNNAPLVGILMGSKSDWETMQAAAKILDEFGVPYEAKVASAHRSPELVAEFVKTAESRGIEVLIAAAGLAAHLPGVVASMTLLPVLGVPMHSQALGGLDALFGDRPNAGRRPRRYARHRLARRQKLRPAGHPHPGQLAPRAARQAPPIPRKNGRGREERYAVVAFITSCIIPTWKHLTKPH